LLAEQAACVEALEAQLAADKIGRVLQLQRNLLARWRDMTARQHFVRWNSLAERQRSLRVAHGRVHASRRMAVLRRATAVWQSFSMGQARLRQVITKLGWRRQFGTTGEYFGMWVNAVREIQRAAETAIHLSRAAAAEMDLVVAHMDHSSRIAGDRRLLYKKLSRSLALRLSHRTAAVVLIAWSNVVLIGRRYRCQLHRAQHRSSQIWVGGVFDGWRVIAEGRHRLHIAVSRLGTRLAARRVQAAFLCWRDDHCRCQREQLSSKHLSALHKVKAVKLEMAELRLGAQLGGLASPVHSSPSLNRRSAWAV
jgi:hypothetical protein